MQRKIEELLKKIEESLFTGKEFEDLIKCLIMDSEGAIEGIKYRLIRNENFELIFGQQGEGEPISKKIVNLGNNDKVEISLWYKNLGFSEQRLEEIFKLFWNFDYCSTSSGLPQREKAEIKQKCNRTILNLLDAKKKIAVFMMDLDNFKKVNDQYDHSKGTMVIHEFASVLLNVINKQAILIHQSGDEFNMIFCYEQHTEVVELAKKMSFEVKSHEFHEAKDIELTMAMGVYLLDNENISFDAAILKAEGLYFPKNTQKQRDSIRVGKKENEMKREDESLKLAYCYIKSNRFKSNILRNIFLDYISKYISCLNSVANHSEEINKIISWINPQWESGIRFTDNGRNEDTYAIISISELGFAIMHGLLKNNSIEKEKLLLDFGTNSNKTLQILLNGVLIYESIKTIQGENVQFDCSLKEKVNATININPDFGKMVVLVQSGYEEIDVPKELFYNIIRIDNRPVIGGGLPDFWSAALCKLISNMNSNKNFTHIILYGDLEHTPKISGYLKNIKKWDIGGEVQYSYLAEKTFKAIHEIENFKNKFSDKIQEIQNKKEIIEHLYDIYKSEDINWEEVIDEPITPPRRFLDRKLTYDRIRLDVTDGCKAQSLSDAFPIVLEILRNSQEENDKIIDQAGRELLELMDFKIKLSLPNSKDLPDFYFKDKEELSQYYYKIFTKNDSLFRGPIERDNQLDSMIEHIVSAIADKEKKYATRRAILIISKKSENSKNYSPLGLVSIWLAPRFRDGIVLMDFSYTWRTVEALVGLPYSLYASIRFAEELVEDIQQKASKINDEIVLKLEQVSYIANSLHMFLDDESMSIVRGIVNEATI